MAELKLRNCPFCDGKASYTDNFYGNGTGHCVFCEDCGAGTAILTGATGGLIFDTLPRPTA